MLGCHASHHNDDFIDEIIKDIVPKFIDEGANIIGGCCGTTPEHIKTISKIISEYNSNKIL